MAVAVLSLVLAREVAEVGRGPIAGHGSFRHPGECGGVVHARLDSDIA